MWSYSSYGQEKKKSKCKIYMGIVIRARIVDCLENPTSYENHDKCVNYDGLTYREAPFLFLDASNT